MAKPLIASGQLSRARAIATIHAIGRGHDIKSLTAGGSGFFRNLPNDDGPQAA